MIAFGLTMFFNIKLSLSKVKESKTWTACPLKMGPIICLETSVTSYKSTLRKIPEERNLMQSPYQFLVTGTKYEASLLPQIRAV